MKKYFSLLLVIMLTFPLLITSGDAAAEKIRSIDVDVILETDGTAKITQKWDVATYSGTEFFIPITYLRDMEIENFKVSDDTGREFEFVENWDVKAGLEDKAFKYGINEVYNGVELCWGKGSYGSHVFIVSWDYKNAVRSFIDYDGFNIRFINDRMNPSPESISIKLSKPGVDLTRENTAIWAFGYRGNLVFSDDGTVIGKSRRALKKDEYMNIMMRFDKGIFNSETIHGSKFENFKNMAMEGASRYNEEYFNKAAIYFFTISFFIILIWLIFYFNGRQSKITTFYNGNRVNLLPRNIPMKSSFRNVDYSRDLPFESDLITIYYTGRIFYYTKSFGDLIAAFLLKWIKDDNLLPIKKSRQDGSVLNENSKLNLEIIKEPEFSSVTERDIWKIIAKAAGDDRILQEKEFENYAKKEFAEISSWINFAVTEGGLKFLELGGLEIIEDNRKTKQTRLNDTGMSFIRSVIGFRKFLKDFTIINEREVIEATLWDDYLIIATVIGMGNEIRKQMESLIPKYVFAQGSVDAYDTSSYYSNYAIITTVQSFADRGSRGYNMGTLTSHDGGGGSSFSGGGGGFSGGGSGGGSR